MDKIHLYDKILSPMVTEKSTNMSEQNKIVFKKRCWCIVLFFDLISMCLFTLKTKLIII